MVESVRFLRMTSDEAPLKGGGGKNNAPLALPREPALRPVLNLIQDLFQGRLLWPVLALVAMLLAGCTSREAEKHYQLGDVLREQGKYAEAEREYREAIRLKPDWAEAHFGLGFALKQQEKYAEAEKEYREAIRLDPDHAEAHYRLGRVLKRFEKTDEEIKEYREAIRLKPDYAEALVVLANRLDDIGERKEARIFWERASKVEKRPEVVFRIKWRLSQPD
jgi:tetratricopeptide (TPR) repeat protein